MAIHDEFIVELEHEALNTQKILSRIPDDKLGWQPHARSMTLGKLACHVAELPRWINHILSETEFDFAKDTFDRLNASATDEIIARFEDIMEEAVKALKNTNDEAFKNTWALKRGEIKILELPRKTAVRSFVMNHLIHHRGQLSVYLRLLDVPVPGMYGPSADEH